MENRYRIVLLYMGLFLAFSSGTVRAQGVRADETFYVYPKIGFVQYTGDQDRKLFHLWDFADGGGSDDGNALPWGGGLEVGYQFRQPWSLGLEGAIGFYPTADDDGENDQWVAYQAKLLGRYTVGHKRLRAAPFGQAGLFVTSAAEDQYDDAGDWRVGFGPLLGLGLDFALTRRLSLMFEAQMMFSFPDQAFDGDDRNPRGSANSSIGGGSGECECEGRGRNQSNSVFEASDMLNFLGVGAKYSFKEAVIPPVARISCPDYILAGDVGTYQAEVEVGATAPLEYRWRFGANGDTGSGLVTSYTFNEPGLYTVFFTVANRGGEDTEVCEVDVRRRPVPPAISGITATPNRFTDCEPVTVTFTSTVTGDVTSHRWSFGDGQTGTGPNPTHTYAEAGTYTATLTVTGPNGETVTSSTQIVVEECPRPCEDIAELRTVYFPLNSSTLTEEGRSALAENAEILVDIQDLCARIEGWAAPGERNPMQLSADRARAIVQFFQDNGVDAVRLVGIGRGRVSDAPSTRKGAGELGRADVIPICCDRLER